MERARQEAQRLRHGHIGAEHILLALLDLEDGQAAELLHNLDKTAIRSSTEQNVGRGTVDPAKGKKIPYTPEAKRVLEQSFEEARNLKRDQIGTGAILLGLLNLQDHCARDNLVAEGLSLEGCREKLASCQDEPKRDVIEIKMKATREQIANEEPISFVTPNGQTMSLTLPKHSVGGRLIRIPKGATEGEAELELLVEIEPDEIHGDVEIAASTPDRFTDRAKSVLALSEQIAQGCHSDEITPEHLLLALTRCDRGVGRLVLEECGIDLAQLENQISVLTPNVAPNQTQPKHGPPVLQIYAWAKEEAATLGHNYHGSEHLVLGLLRDSESPSSAFLRSQGASLEGARNALQLVLSK